MVNVKIYTDGSCLKPNGPSGWAFLAIEPTRIWQFSDGYKSSTNNRMELTAVIEALEFCEEFQYDTYEVFSDSMYVINGITDWIKKWRKIDFKNIKNDDLWRRLDKAVDNKDITWKWIKAHNGDKYNEIVDSIAKQEAKNIKIDK